MMSCTEHYRYDLCSISAAPVCIETADGGTTRLTVFPRAHETKRQIRIHARPRSQVSAKLYFLQGLARRGNRFFSLRTPLQQMQSSLLLLTESRPCSVRTVKSLLLHDVYPYLHTYTRARSSSGTETACVIMHRLRSSVRTASKFYKYDRFEPSFPNSGNFEGWFMVFTIRNLYTRVTRTRFIPAASARVHKVHQQCSIIL